MKGCSVSSPSPCLSLYIYFFLFLFPSLGFDGHSCSPEGGHYLHWYVRGLPIFSHMSWSVPLQGPLSTADTDGHSVPDPARSLLLLCRLPVHSGGAECQEGGTFQELALRAVPSWARLPLLLSSAPAVCLWMDTRVVSCVLCCCEHASFLLHAQGRPEVLPPGGPRAAFSLSPRGFVINPTSEPHKELA